MSSHIVHDIGRQRYLGRKSDCRSAMKAQRSTVMLKE